MGSLTSTSWLGRVDGAREPPRVDRVEGFLVADRVVAMVLSSRLGVTATPCRGFLFENDAALHMVPEGLVPQCFRRPRPVVAALLTVALWASACGGPSSPTELDGSTTDALAAATDAWIDRYRVATEDLDGVSTLAPGFVGDLLAESRATAAAAERLRDEGDVAGAHRSAVHATALATGVGALDAAYDILVEQGPVAFGEAVRAGDTVGEDVGVELGELLAFEPSNVSQAAALAAGYATALDAASLALLGVELLERPGRDAQEQVWLHSLSGFYVAVAPVLAEAAVEQVELGSDLDGPPIVGDAWAAGTAFRSAANARLDRFQEDVIGVAAEAAGVENGPVLDALAGFDLDYSLAVANLHLLDVLDEVFGGTPNEAYALLGGALSAYERTHALDARYTDYGWMIDESLTIVSDPEPQVLLEARVAGEERLEASLEWLRDGGIVPLDVIARLEAGRVVFAEDGSSDDAGTASPDVEVTDVGALTSVWGAETTAAVLAYLGGIEGSVPEREP